MNCTHATVTLQGDSGLVKYCPTCDRVQCLQCGEPLVKGALSPNRWHLNFGPVPCQNWISEHTIQTRTRITEPMIPILACECGARSIGVADWTPWHSDRCPVRRE